MATNVVELNCPGCGASVSLDMKHCTYCGRELVIETFNSVREMSLPELNKTANSYKKALAQAPDNAQANMSAAFCYLKLKMYDKAGPCFDKAIEETFDNSELYFYAAVSLLQGKKAFLHVRGTIDRILEYVNAALMIEPKGIYYYFLAYVKYDYFYRKGLHVSPNYAQTLMQAKNAGLSPSDVHRLYELLGVPRPECL